MIEPCTNCGGTGCVECGDQGINQVLVQKNTTTLVKHLEDYDTGFNCVHERAFDCDDCMESLSKRQRADAAEITRLKARVKDITEACDAEFEVNARMRVL